MHREFIEYIVQDPFDLAIRRIGNETRLYPKTVWRVVVELNGSYHDIIAGDRPQSVLLDEAIVKVALVQDGGILLSGDDHLYTEWCCSQCGGGLGVNQCSSCGRRYDDDHFRSGGNTPLPPKVVEFLRSVVGHTFRHDPATLAWPQEQQEFNRRREMRRR